MQSKDLVAEQMAGKVLVPVLLALAYIRHKVHLFDISNSLKMAACKMGH